MSSDANELTEIMGSKGSKHKEKSHGEDDNPEDMCLVKEEVIEDDAKITEHMLKVNPSTEANDLNGDVINTEISNNTAADAKIAEHKNNKKEDDIPERDKNEQKSDDKPESTDTEKTSQSDASKTVDDSGTAEKKTDDSINEPPIVPSDDNKKVILVKMDMYYYRPILEDNHMTLDKVCYIIHKDVKLNHFLL